MSNTKHEFGFSGTGTPRGYYPFCSCGWTGSAIFLLRKDGQPTAVMYREHRYHVTRVASPKPPVLVGEVEYQRVTHEVWIYHLSHPFPQPFAQNVYAQHLENVISRYKSRDPIYRSLGHPFVVLLRKSNGYTPIGFYSSFQWALIGAHKHIENQADRGRKVTLATGLAGRRAYPAPIQENIKSLVQGHGAARSIPGLKKALDEIDEAIAATSVLTGMRQELEKRLQKQMEVT